MKLKPYYLGLVLLIMLGLTASSAFGVGGAGTVTGGTFPACVDPANTNTSTVKIAGKQVAPGGLVRVPTGTTCLSSETTLNLNSYVKTVLVSPSATDAASGTNLQTAVNAATFGTLVKLEPGLYDLVTTPLTMKPGVDLEGSGEGLTTISSQINDVNFPPTVSTVVITSGSEIRFLTIVNTSTSLYSTAVYANGVNKTAKLTNLTATTIGTGPQNFGLLAVNSSSPTIFNANISASKGSNNYGIYNDTSSSPTILDSTISASGVSGSNNAGIYNISSSAATIQNSTVTASGGSNNWAIYNTSSTAPTIRNSTISASGGSNNWAIFNSSSAATIQNSTVTASGGSAFNYGVRNSGSSSSAIQNSTITASGGGSSINYGVYNITSSSSIQNSTITADGGNNDYGIISTGSSSTTQNSTITASGGSSSNNSIFNTSSTAQVGGSQLSAVVSGTGFTCINNYNASFTALSATCT